MLQWIQVGNAQGIGHDAASYGTTHGPPDILILGVAHEIPDDQEVSVEAHLMNDAQLVPEASFDLWRDDDMAIIQTFLAEVAQVTLSVVIFGHLEDRQVIARPLQAQVASLGYEQAVAHCFRRIGEEGSHFLAAFEIEALTPHGHVLGIVDGGVGLDAKEYLLGPGLLGQHIVGIVGGHERDAHFSR